MLVDDHASAREPLAFMLDRLDDIEIVATAGSVTTAREALAENLDLDVAVLDLGLPDGSGTELISTVHATCPRAVVLVLTAYVDRVHLAEAIASGAAGVLDKSSEFDDITDAIRRLAKGDAMLSARDVSEAIGVAAALREWRHRQQAAVQSLTDREREIVDALATGLSDKEIAAELSIGVGTVRTHVNSVMSKLGVRSRLQAVLAAARLGLVELGET